jgi:hypothetical protein
MKPEKGRASTTGWFLRCVQICGAAALVGAAAMSLLSPGASASSLTSGPVSLNTQGVVTPGTPYTGGQTIDLVVAANTTMNNAAMVAAGYPSGADPIKFLECADPGGTTANLPTKPTQCEPATVESNSGAATDGSMSLIGGNGYTVYALPDSGLGSNGTVCDSKANPCVIGIFADQNDFTKPHLFSAPFYVSVGDGLDLGDNPGDGSPLTQASTDPGKSTVVAAPNNAVADGVDASKVTVTLKDTNGNPVSSGKQISVSQGSGHSVITVGSVATTTATTDANGMASFNVTDAMPEVVTYTVTDTSDSNLAITATPSVTFSAPVVTSANSTVAAVANGPPSVITTPWTITVTLRDQAASPQPLIGKTVALSPSSGSSTTTAVSPTTNAQGQATFTVSDTAAETVTYTATSGSVTAGTVAVTFGTLAVSASVSTVTPQTQVVLVTAGGTVRGGTIVVTLLGGDGTSAVAGKTVTMTTPSTTVTISPETPGSDVTGVNGTATFTVSDTTAEPVTWWSPKLPL